MSIIKDRIKYLKILKEGNEQQAVAMELNIRLAEKKLKDASKRPEEEKWAIEKKLLHHAEELNDLLDGLEVIEKEIENENKEQKG